MTDRNTFDLPLTVEEVAEMHRVSRRTVDRWIRSRVLPASKLPGGQVRIERADAQALLTPTSPSSVDSPITGGGALPRTRAG